MSKRDAGNRPPMAAIVMAAGRGSRMLAKSLPKVCFPVLGEPAINRTLRSCRKVGIESIVVVVGDDGDQVMRTISDEHEGVLFAHQPVPRGTGHAVRAGFEPLRRMGYEGLVWCVVGDKVVEPQAFDRVLRAFDADTDAAFAVTDKPQRDDMGHVLRDSEGRVVGIFERNDLAAARLLGELDEELRGRRAPRAGALRRRCLEALGTPDRCERFLGRVWRLAQGRGKLAASRLRAAMPERPGLLPAGASWMPVDEILASAPYKNESLYCFRARTLARGLRLMPVPKGKREDYFTNIVSALLHPRRGAPARVKAVLLEDPTWLMGFNTPEQLLAIEDAIRERAPVAVRVSRREIRLGRAVYKRAGEWARMFETVPPRLRSALASVYGDADAVRERGARLRETARRFAERYGADRRAVLVRAPAGINLMGRHVDEVGGYVNVMSVDREVLFMAAPREDDLVRLTRADGPDETARFSVSREIGALGWDDWLNFISSEKVRQMIVSARSDWSSPARAAVLRLQQQFRSRRLHGMDAVICDEVPMAAGMGASGTLMVAASEAYLLLNEIDLAPEEMLGLCGEGQRFLGRDGPPARHAAAKMGQRGQIVRMRFAPFEVDKVTPWPEDLDLALCRLPAQSRAGGALAHRQRLFAAMQLGVLYVKDRSRPLAHLVDRLSDIDPRRLGVPLSAVYEMLLRVPIEADRATASRQLSRENRQRLDEIFEPLDSPKGLPPRDALMFGMAECRRSEIVSESFASGDLEVVGKLMACSHAAERHPADASAAVTDATLRDLIDDLKSEDPERVRRAQLEYRTGRYGSSTPAIDAVVDAARAIPEVVAAQLSGSGTGGCVMALVAGGGFEKVARDLRKGREGLTVERLRPVAGSGAVRT